MQKSVNPPKLFPSRSASEIATWAFLREKVSPLCNSSKHGVGKAYATMLRGLNGVLGVAGWCGANGGSGRDGGSAEKVVRGSSGSEAGSYLRLIN